MQHERHYHTDVIKTRHTRLYRYADIAVSAYQTLKTKQTNCKAQVFPKTLAHSRYFP